MYIYIISHIVISATTQSTHCSVQEGNTGS